MNTECGLCRMFCFNVTFCCFVLNKTFILFYFFRMKLTRLGDAMFRASALSLRGRQLEPWQSPPKDLINGASLLAVQHLNG